MGDMIPRIKAIARPEHLRFVADRNLEASFGNITNLLMVIMRVDGAYAALLKHDLHHHQRAAHAQYFPRCMTVDYIGFDEFILDNHYQFPPQSV